MTQREQVLALVSRPGGACIESFLHARIPRYSARIFEIRREGKTIVEQPCERHDHGRKTPAWVLTYDPEMEHVDPVGNPVLF